MKEGKLVPTEVTVRLLRQAMQSSSNDKFLIDGFPRALDQAETFEQEVKPPELVLFFDCPEVWSSCHPLWSQLIYQAMSGCMICLSDLNRFHIGDASRMPVKPPV